MSNDTLIQAAATAQLGNLAEAVAEEGWPGAQGSAACCAVLRALYIAAPKALNRQTLQSLTGLDDETFAAALSGLRQRRRIECKPAGPHSAYMSVLPQGHLPAREQRLP